MLKNEDLKHISYSITLLTIIREYALSENTTDFYDKTGITILDIDKSIKQLIHIQSTQRLKHLQASERTNKWNKAHIEQHRKHSRDSHRRNKRIQKQVNNMRIIFSKTYNKYQVIAPTKIILEEFNSMEDAINWAKQQKDYLKKEVK